MKSANKSTEILQIKIYLLLYSPTRHWCVGEGRRKEAKMIGLTPYPVLCRPFQGYALS